MHRKSSTYAGIRSSGSTVPASSRAELGVQPIHGVSGEMSGHRLEPDDAGAVGTTFHDVVVRGFPMATATRCELEQVAVQLQHDVGRQSDVLGVAVNHAQDLAVARDLLLGAIRWRGAMGNEVPDALQRRDDSLDAVRRLGALDDGVLAQRLENLGGLLFEESLFAAVLADEPDALDQPLVDGLPVEHAVLERFRHELDHIIGS